ncbi:hypothetical protein P9305_14460 [Lysinibacillus capsici]|uniref:hypothetical protein n=1 Tax=Lysinibacillus capsici TaxID=2115968 RepID=UPI0028E4ADEB|nr:hypothetical protein [Lysinibacillus capsici]MED4553931.1 hypothetical protein [Lysinibacillus capsici]
MLFSFISLIVIILVALFVIKSFSLYKKRAEKKKFLQERLKNLLLTNIANLNKNFSKRNDLILLSANKKYTTFIVKNNSNKVVYFLVSFF